MGLFRKFYKTLYTYIKKTSELSPLPSFCQKREAWELTLILQKKEPKTFPLYQPTLISPQNLAQNITLHRNPYFTHHFITPYPTSLTIHSWMFSVTILIWSCIWLPPSLKLSLFKDVFSPLHLITELYNEKVSSMDVVAEMRCPFTLWPFPVLQRQPQAPNGITHAKAHTQNLGLILNLTVNSPEV